MAGSLFLATLAGGAPAAGGTSDGWKIVGKIFYRHP
jgi:hypothetical protein